MYFIVYVQPHGKGHITINKIIPTNAKL